MCVCMCVCARDTNLKERERERERGCSAGDVATGSATYDEDDDYPLQKGAMLCVQLVVKQLLPFVHITWPKYTPVAATAENSMLVRYL